MIKSLDLWLPAYLRRGRSIPAAQVTDICIAVCDHFEPFHDADKKVGMERLANWKKNWPRLIEPFSDSDGIRPRHSFFYPIEQYDADVLNEIAEICRLSGGEVEIHLHHDGDTAETLRAKIEQGKADFRKHNLLCSDGKGNVRYGFIHGNWALDNSHPQHRNCGVSNELAVLRDTGCYADFTMPSAPHPTQTRIINSLYYARGTPRPKSHDTGVLVNANGAPTKLLRDDLDYLLLVQGPLGLNWERRKYGVLPRIENADLTGANPPTADRMRLWRRLGIHIQGRPNWLFVKLHTHGAIPRNSGMFLGEPMRQFHQHLMDHYKHGVRLHYVTAREMVNIIHAAEDGHTGNPGSYRDYRYTLKK